MKYLSHKIGYKRDLKILHKLETIYKYKCMVEKNRKKKKSIIYLHKRLIRIDYSKKYGIGRTRTTVVIYIYIFVFWTSLYLYYICLSN